MSFQVGLEEYPADNPGRIVLPPAKVKLEGYDKPCLIYKVVIHHYKAYGLDVCYHFRSGFRYVKLYHKEFEKLFRGFVE